MKLQLEVAPDGASGYLRAIGTPDRAGARDAAAAPDTREDLLALYGIGYGRLGPVGLFAAWEAA